MLCWFFSPRLWESAVFTDFQQPPSTAPSAKKMFPFFFHVMESDRRRCGNCGTSRSEFFSGGFSKQLVEIIKKKLPKASLFDFHSCGSFHSACRQVEEWLRNGEIHPCEVSTRLSIVVPRRF